jgi:glycosyltransferase involved in cell wall biosynthesis
MKKLLVIHNKYREIGGEDIAVDNEVNLLKEKYIVEELYFSNNFKNYLIQAFYLIFNKNFQSLRLIEKKLKEYKPDVVYIHNTWFKISPAIFKMLEKYDGVEIIVKLHNFRFFCTKSYFSREHLNNQLICEACGMKKNKFMIFNKYFYDSYTRSLIAARFGKKYYKILKSQKFKILTLTNFQKSFLIDLGFDQNKIYVHRNYIDTSNIQKYEFDLNETYIVYAGRISEEKGVEEIIEAYNSLNKPSFGLKVIGNGPQKKYLVKKYSGYKNISFLGTLDNNIVKDIIGKSMAVITGTKLYEGQPTLLCEASIVGVPSIFPDNGGIKEFFPKDYKLIYKNDNIQNLIDNLNKLDLQKNVEEIGFENKIFISKLIGKEAYFESFNKVLNG